MPCPFALLPGVRFLSNGQWVVVLVPLTAGLSRHWLSPVSVSPLEAGLNGCAPGWLVDLRGIPCQHEHMMHLLLGEQFMRFDADKGARSCGRRKYCGGSHRIG